MDELRQICARLKIPLTVQAPGPWQARLQFYDNSHCPSGDGRVFHLHVESVDRHGE